MAVKATYLPTNPSTAFLNGIPARNISDAEWATLTPAAAPVVIEDSDDDPPTLVTTITTATPHGLVTGDLIVIEGHTGSTPDLNGVYRVLQVDEDPSAFEISIPVPCTVPGTGGTVTKQNQQGLIALSPSIYTVAP